MENDLRALWWRAAATETAPALGGRTSSPSWTLVFLKQRMLGWKLLILNRAPGHEELSNGIYTNRWSVKIKKLSSQAIIDVKQKLIILKSKFDIFLYFQGSRQLDLNKFGSSSSPDPLAFSNEEESTPPLPPQRTESLMKESSEDDDKVVEIVEIKKKKIIIADAEPCNSISNNLLSMATSPSSKLKEVVHLLDHLVETPIVPLKLAHTNVSSPTNQNSLSRSARRGRSTGWWCSSCSS